MNILAQCCGIVLLLVILYFYNSQKKIRLHTGQAFMGIWVAAFISLLLDTNSMVLLTYREYLPDLVVRFGCKAYVSSLVWQAILYIIYVCSDIYNKDEMYSRYKKRLYGCGIFFMLVVLALPIYIHAESATDTYTYGPAVVLTYIVAATALLLLAILLRKHRDKMNPNRRRAVRVWMGVWLLAAVIQFLNNALLLVGYASAVGVMIIYLRLENPEANLDRKTGLFNQTAFLLYMKQLLNQEEDYYLLGMSYSLGNGENLSSDAETAIYMEFIQFISEIPGATVFRCEDDMIVFVFFDAGEMDSGYHSLMERFEKPWGKSLARMMIPHWYYVANPRIVHEEKEYLDLFQYAEQFNRDFVHIDEDMLRSLYSDQAIERMIVEAMREDRIEVYYQPIYSTHRNQFASAEALVRIRDKEGNIIMPGCFIEVAERTGLIMRLGEIVFEKVCHFIKEEKPEQYGIEYIEVNLSIIQCGYEYLAASYKRIMREYEVSPRAINLEITETASLSEKRTLLENMRELREYGVTFSLDDFGTGQSNLNYIVDMPVDIVKFDRDMIQSYFANDKAKYVMDAAMHMIHGLNLKIVSEGVETQEQYATMEELGISYVQGYYFSRPLPQEEFLAFIRDRRGGIVPVS